MNRIAARNFAVLLGLVLAAPAAARDLPGGLVYLRDIDPSIAQDMRYASRDNFVGQPLPGYDAPECVLRRDAALALRQVQAFSLGNPRGYIDHDNIAKPSLQRKMRKRTPNITAANQCYFKSF